MPFAVLWEGQRKDVPPGSSVVIGRGVDADIRIDHPYVARHQATLRNAGGTLTLAVPPANKNPTFVDGNPVDDIVELRDGARIVLVDLETGPVLEIVMAEPGPEIGSAERAPRWRLPVNSYVPSRSVSVDVPQPAGKPAAPATLTADYTRWRRGVLWLSALVLGGTTALNLWGQVPGAVDLATEAGIPALITAQTILLLALTALGVIALAYGVIRWDHLPASGRSVRLAWHFFYTIPLATYVIPWAFVVPVTDEDVAAVADELISGLTGITPSAFGLDIGASDVRNGLGLMFALYAVFAFGPRLLALLPAILRSGAAIKVIIPATSHPGWAASVVAPSYALVVAVGFVAAIQLAWSWQLVAAMGAFLLAALMWVRRGGELSVPMDRATAVGLVDRIRREWTVLSGIGVVFAFWAFATLPNVDPLAAGRFMASYIGNTLFITVLVADLMIRRLPDTSVGGGERDDGIAVTDLRRSMHL